MFLGLTFQQAAAIAIVAGLLGFLVWDRWRFDLVALTALLASVVAGVVPAEKAFDGFSDQVIVVIACVLIVSKAVSASGFLDRIVRRLLRGVHSASWQIGWLCGAVALLSAFVKNVGTLGIFMPIAIQIARRSKRSPSIYLMPLAFASLIGGTITQIGTSPNLLISTVREDLTGKPFRLFDYAWVGLPLTFVAIVFLSVGWRLLPRERRAAVTVDEAFSIEDYATELVIGEASPIAGKTVAQLESSVDDHIVVVGVLREGGHHYIPSASWPLYAGDVVTIQAEPAAVKRLLDETKLDLANARELRKGADSKDDIEIVEAVVTAESPMIGNTAQSLSLRMRFDVNVIAVSRAGSRRAPLLKEHVFEVGDVIVVQGWEASLQRTLSELGLLPLADRGVSFGSARHGLVSLAVLALAMLLISMKVTTVGVGFFGAAMTLVLLKQISMKRAYSAIEGPVLVLLAALIPIAHSLQATGLRI